MIDRYFKIADRGFSVFEHLIPELLADFVITSFMVVFSFPCFIIGFIVGGLRK